MVLKNGLSRMRGDPHVRFLGGGGAAMRRCYPTAWYVEGNSKAASHTLHCLNGKRSAQAQRGGGVRDQSRMAVTRHEARGNAHEPDGGTPGRPESADRIHCTGNIAVLSNADADKLERQIVIGCCDRYRRNRLFRSGFD